MDQRALQNKLETLARFPTVENSLVDRVGTILPQLDDWDLLQLNPLALAEDHQLARDPMLDLFVHGVKVGLVDFIWNTVCPRCGTAEYSYRSINDISTDSFFCTSCQAGVYCSLDQEIRVSFSINPAVRRLNIDPFADLESYGRYFLLREVVHNYLAGAFPSRQLIAFHAVPADGEQTITFEAEPGQDYGLFSLDLHTICHVHTAERAGRDPVGIDVTVLDGGCAPGEVTVSPGRVGITLRNIRRQKTGFLLMKATFMDPDEMMNSNMRNEFRPYVTAKILLNNQSFRELFRLNELRPDLRLDIRSLTVLFTDLRGSTQLYDLLGDAYAYGLIQEHFRVLFEAVRANTGAVVKTMGDAVMATFSTPQDGLRAAIQMLRSMQAINEQLPAEAAGHELGLKIGLHEGPALTVNANDRLDYFGQTVNIAARVQGLAQAGEIWITDPIFQAPTIDELVQSACYRYEKRSVLLKGVRDQATVYRLFACS